MAHWFQGIRETSWARPERLLESLWLTTLFFLPLFFYPGTYTSFELPKVVFFQVLVFAMVVSWILMLMRAVPSQMVAAKSQKIERITGKWKNAHFQYVAYVPHWKEMKWLIILLCSVVFTWILSTTFSPTPLVSFFGIYPRFQGLLTWLHSLLFATILFFHLRQPEQFGRLFKVMFASALLVSLIAILQKTGMVWLDYWDVSAFLGRAFGTLGHPDYLAGFLILIIPLLVARLLTGKDSVIGSLALTVSFVALYFSLSRGAFLGLFIGMFVFFLVYFKKKWHPTMFWATLLSPLLAIFILVIVQVYQQLPFIQNNEILHRLVLEGENLRSVETRLALWPATLQLIKDRPLLGYGFDSYGIIFPQYAPEQLNILENFGDIPDRAHNFLLDYAVMFGIPGLLAFLAFFCLILKKSFAFILKDKGENWTVPLGFVSGIISLFVANAFSFFVTVQWVYFWTMLAVFWRLTSSKNSQWSLGWLQKMPAKIIVAFVLGIFSTYSVWSGMNLLRADAVYREFFQKQNSESLHSLLSLVQEAAQRAPQYSFYSEQEANVALNAALQTYDQAERTQLFSKALVAVERMGSLENSSGRYFLLRGKILAEQARLYDNQLYDQAYDAFKKAQQKMPNNPSIYLEYGRALLANGLYEDAAEHFEKYLSLSPPYYQWKTDLAERSWEDQEKYRIFYKLHPDFNAIFGLLFEAYTKAGNLQKVEEYKQYLYF